MKKPYLLAWLEAPARNRGIHFAQTADEWSFWSYEQLALSATALANCLVESGVGANEVVSLVLPSGPEFVITFFGTMLAGATPSPIAPPQVFQDVATYGRYVVACLKTARPAIVVTDRGSLTRVLDCADSRQAPPVLTFDDLSKRADDSFLWPARPAAEIAVLQFTSGSSGHGRAVRVGFDALECNAKAIRRWLRWGEDDVFASWLPLHHDMGLVGALLCTTVGGNDLWLMRPEHFIRNPLRYLRCFGTLGATMTATASFGVDHIVRHVRPEGLAGMDFTHWRVMVVGAERIEQGSLETMHVLLRPFGFKRETFLPAYGLAEATLAVTGVPVGEAWITVSVDPNALSVGGEIHLALGGQGAVRVVGCGHPLDGVIIEVVDEGGQQVSEGRVGEIIVRGVSVALGYSSDDYSTSLTTFSGVLHTGDAGFIHEGQLFILGRLGDSIKVRGRLIFGEDLEVALIGIGVPRLRVAALLGVHKGAPTAVVVIESAKSRPAAVAAMIRRHAEGAKIVVVEAPTGTIRRTGSGKPKRRELWQAFATGKLRGNYTPKLP